MKLAHCVFLGVASDVQKPSESKRQKQSFMLVDAHIFLLCAVDIDHSFDEGTESEQMNAKQVVLESQLGGLGA